MLIYRELFQKPGFRSNKSQHCAYSVKTRFFNIDKLCYNESNSVCLSVCVHVCRFFSLSHSVCLSVCQSGKSVRLPKAVFSRVGLKCLNHTRYDVFFLYFKITFNSLKKRVILNLYINTACFINDYRLPAYIYTRKR